MPDNRPDSRNRGREQTGAGKVMREEFRRILSGTYSGIIWCIFVDLIYLVYSYLIVPYILSISRIFFVFDVFCIFKYIFLTYSFVFQLISMYLFDMFYILGPGPGPKNVNKNEKDTLTYVKIR